MPSNNKRMSQAVPRGTQFVNAGGDSRKTGDRKPIWLVQPELLRLRAAGYTYRECGAAAGISANRAQQIIKQAVASERYDGVAEMRQQEGSRLDALQVAIWDQAIEGDVKSVLAVLRIMERRARLFGLDAPIELNVSTDTDRQIAQLAEAIQVKAEPPAIES